MPQHLIEQGEEIRTVYAIPEKIVWIGTWQGSIWSFDMDATWRQHRPSSKQPLGAVRSFYQEPTGCLWIGTDSGLFSRQDGAWAYHGYFWQRDEEGHIEAMVMDDLGRLWVAGEGIGLW